MARRKSTKAKRPIESYQHTGKERVNNPRVGLGRAQGRGEHEDMPDNQHRVAAGVGGMVGLRRAVARWGLRGIIGWTLFLMSLWVGRRPSIQ